MKELKRRFNRFCFRNRDKGIPNLMLYITLGAAALALMNMIDPSHALYSMLCFDKEAILQGQVWRLISYPLCYAGSISIGSALMMICYYSLGRGIENLWGTLRFNLYYFTGVLLMDVYCLIFDGFADVSYLNMSLFLTYATLYPNAEFLLFFIIPVKAWILAVIDLVTVFLGLFSPFPYNLFGLIALGNYFLFFGKGFVNVDYCSAARSEMDTHAVSDIRSSLLCRYEFLLVFLLKLFYFIHYLSSFFWRKIRASHAPSVLYNVC